MRRAQQRQNQIYQKNGYRVAFVHVYKETKWESFLVKVIMDIEEKRHDEVMKMIKSLKFSRACAHKGGVEIVQCKAGY